MCYAPSALGFARLEPAFEAPACRSVREAAEQKAKAASEAAYANGGTAAAKRAEALEQKTDAEFRQCFARSAAKEGGFADVVKRVIAVAQGRRAVGRITYFLSFDALSVT